MTNFKSYYNESIKRLEPSKGEWFHGDKFQRNTFKDQRMDRDQHESANEHGPGIYFTRKFSEALGYAEPNGYVYTVKMNVTQKIIKDGMKSNPELIKKLIDWCPEERKEIGLSNWDENPNIAMKKAISTYSNYRLMESCLAVYKDFYGTTEANEWTNSMVAAGFDAYWRFLGNDPENAHLIVYNPQIISIIQEKDYHTASEEFYNA